MALSGMKFPLKDGMPQLMLFFRRPFCLDEPEDIMCRCGKLMASLIEPNPVGLDQVFLQRVIPASPVHGNRHCTTGSHRYVV